MATRRGRVSFAALKRKLLTWPGVEESTSYGRPSLRAFGKFLTRLKEDGDSIVITGINFDEREMLMETQGAVFYITDHYKNFPSVLMRLSRAGGAAVEAMLRRRWRQAAPRKILAALEQPTMASATPRRSPAKPKRRKTT